MKKIIVIGCPGSGKSYFCKRLSEILKIDKYHMDCIYWKPNWIPCEKDIFLNQIQEILNKDSFILDGNYNSSLKMRFEQADTIYFLDLPTDICLESIKQRTGKKREDLPDYLIEDGSDEEFLELVKHFNENNRQNILNLIEIYKNKNIIVFKSREEVNEYLNKLNRL